MTLVATALHFVFTRYTRNCLDLPARFLPVKVLAVFFRVKYQVLKVIGQLQGRFKVQGIDVGVVGQEVTVFGATINNGHDILLGKSRCASKKRAQKLGKVDIRRTSCTLS